MNRHKFNIFPEAKPEDYARLIDDIQDNGYDQDQPVILYQGAILDGWNRNKACVELMIKPPTKQFVGSELEAIQFVMRTNKRRSLSSGQWATVAVEAEDIMGAIAEQVETDADAKRSEATKAQRAGEDKKLSAPQKAEHADKTATKAAELFQTNRTYINQATKIQKASPEVFAKVKAGTMTMQDANKAVRAIPTAPWREDERQRHSAVAKGQAVIANEELDKNLIEWARRLDKVVRIDRGTIYGNPFTMPGDGDRDAVCDAYEKHYLKNKPSILKTLSSLKGMVLVCHCYPERCHGLTILEAMAT
jgi:Domain of unknown function (DUF4326)